MFNKLKDSILQFKDSKGPPHGLVEACHHSLGNADEERLLGILDGPVVLLSVVLQVAQLPSVPPLELVSGSLVPGNSLSLVVVNWKQENDTK